MANAAGNPAHGAKPGPRSLCARFAAEIMAAVEAGLSAKRIHQDLIRERGFCGGYTSVKQYVRRLVATTELPFRRMECEPGAELQFDFGRGGWVVEEGKWRRRPHLFRAVLSHSRKGYSEVVWRQDTETVLRCLENAFRAFGGVPAAVVPDYVSGHIIGVLCARTAVFRILARLRRTLTRGRPMDRSGVFRVLTEVCGRCGVDLNCSLRNAFTPSCS